MYNYSKKGGIYIMNESFDLAKYIGARIKYFRKEKKLTQDELGEAIGTKKATISNYETGYRSPNQDTIFEIAWALNISINDLFPPTTREGSINYLYNQLNPDRQTKVYNFAEYQLEEQEQSEYIEEKSIIYGRSTAAGQGKFVDDADAYEVRPSSMVPRGADELVEVVGESMEPLIKDGDEVYIRHQPTVENGEIAIVRINDEGVTCKRVYVKGDKVILKSENVDYDDMEFGADEIVVLGKVLL